MKKTDEEIHILKENWKRDPFWDIENTKGFEDHYQELLQWRKKLELEYQHKEEERITRRVRVVELETGVISSGASLNISTYKEIENLVDHPERQSLSIEDTIGVAQVRATLLLAAQTQRIADLIQAQMDEAELNRESDDIAKV